MSHSPGKLKQDCSLRWVGGLLAVLFLCYGLVLFTDYTIWDGWFVGHDLLNQCGPQFLPKMASEGGRPIDLFVLSPLAWFGNPLLTAKVADFVAYCLSSVLAFGVLRHVVNLPVGAAWVTVAVGAALPFYDFVGDIQLWMYSSQTTMFWAGWFCYAVAACRFGVWMRIAGLGLLFVSFNFNSLLTFHYGLITLIVLLMNGGSRKLNGLANDALSFLKSNVALVALPFVFWTWKKVFTPTHGFYSSYNQLKFDPQTIAGVYASYFQSLWVPQIHEILALPLVVGMALLLGVVAASLFARIPEGLFIQSRAYVAESLWLRSAAGALIWLILSILPYALVGQPPEAFGWNSRNALILGTPTALVMVSFFCWLQGRFAPTHPQVAVFAATAVLSMCAVASNLNILRLQGLGAKQLAVVDKVQPWLKESGVVVVQLRDYFPMERVINYYPPIIWTFMLAKNLAKPLAFVFDTRPYVADTIQRDPGGREHNQVAVISLTPDNVKELFIGTTVPYSLQHLPTSGKQGLAIIAEGTEGNDPVGIGARYLWIRWLSPQTMPAYLRNLIRAEMVQLPDIN